MYIEATHGLQASNALFGGIDQLIIHSLKVSITHQTLNLRLVYSLLRYASLHLIILYNYIIAA